MLQKVAFTMYPVKDMARARSFYEGALGLEVSSKSTSGMWTEYDLPGGGCLALFKTSDIQPSSAAGGSIAFARNYVVRFGTSMTAPASHRFWPTVDS